MSDLESFPAIPIFWINLTASSKYSNTTQGNISQHKVIHTHYVGDGKDNEMNNSPRASFRPKYRRNQ